MLYFLLALTSALVASVGAITYIHGIMRRDTKPRMSSWVAWSMSWGVLLALALGRQSYAAAIFAAAGMVRSGAVVLAAYWRGDNEWTLAPVDWICLALAGMCLGVLALVPSHVLLGAVCAGAANLFATWPTLYHAWRNPYADDYTVYAFNCGACLLTIGAVVLGGGFVGVATLAGPVVSLVGNASVVSFIVARRMVKGVRHRRRPDVTLDDKNTALAITASASLMPDLPLNSTRGVMRIGYDEYNYRG